MRAVIQRVKEASVTIDGEIAGEIQQGLLVFLGITHSDTKEDVDWLSKKIVGLRVFNDLEGKMNLSLIDIGGEVLVVSQFTLFAKTKKGNRPSYTEAAKPETAIPLYEGFIKSLNSKLKTPCAAGRFGADMKVSLLNNGPVTIIIDTKQKDL